MFLFKMAMKNLTRHKRRVFATAFILSISIMLFLFSDSLVGGMGEMSYDNLIDLEIGHFQIMNKEYFDNRDELKLKNLMTMNDNLRDNLENTDEINGYYKEARFFANLNNGIDEIPVTAIGIEPAKLTNVLDLDKYIEEGEYLTGAEYEVLIGKDLAELMDFTLGDYVTLVFKTEDEAFNTIDAEIKGIINSRNPSINSNYVYMPLDLAQKSLNIGNKFTQIVVKTTVEREKIYKVTEKFQKELENSKISVYIWDDLAESVKMMVRQGNIENGVMMFLLLALASIGVVNTIFLSALERTREIGMMKALGFKKKEIVAVFMYEAAGIGFIGGLVGVIGAIPFVAYLVNEGIYMAGINGGDWGIPILNTIYGSWQPTHFVAIFIFAIVISMVASYFPANSAAKKDPVDTIEEKPQ